MAELSLEERITRIEDNLEIQKLMGKYAYYIMAGMQSDLGELLFARRPDTRVYFGEQGYFEGPDAPERAWVGFLGNVDRTGFMALHAPICPVVEIAGDGKTAKGVWIGLGLLAMKRGEEGTPYGAWEWDKYGIDFIKEDGKWKIWHHHIYRLLHGWGVDEKWAEQFAKPEPSFDLKLDGPAVDDNPYHPDTRQRLVPKPPEPYDTYKPEDMY